MTSYSNLAKFFMLKAPFKGDFNTIKIILTCPEFIPFKTHCDMLFPSEFTAMCCIF